MALYLYATGAQRQSVTVLSHLGLTSSYSTLTGSGLKEDSSSSSPANGGAEDTRRNSAPQGRPGGASPTASTEAPPRRPPSRVSVRSEEEEDAEWALLSDGESSSSSATPSRINRPSTDANPTQTSLRPSAPISTETQQPSTQERSQSPAADSPTDVPPKELDPAVPTRSEDPTPPAKGGVLRRLSNWCRRQARRLAATGYFVTIYDNINALSKVAEQRVGRKGELSAPL